MNSPKCWLRQWPVLILAAVATPCVGFDTVGVSDGAVSLAVRPGDGALVELRSRYVSPYGAGAEAVFARISDAFPALRLVGVSCGRAGWIRRYESESHLGVEFRCDSVAPGVGLEGSYALFRSTYQIEARFALRGDSALTYVSRQPLCAELCCGSGEQSPASRSWIMIRHGRARELSCHKLSGDTIAPGVWAGTRSRYFGLLVRPSAGALLVQRCGSASGCVLRPVDTCATSLVLRLSVGPISRFGPQHSPNGLMLFHTLWFWIRWLSLGMLYLLHWLIAATREPGVAVMLLSVCVKVLMFPLTRVAVRWQREVNETTSRLAPLLDEIKRHYTGEQRHRRIMELYRAHGVSPWYSLKSLGSAALQIPIFFAAYHMLHENIELAGVPFLWIDDLALPDRSVALPLRLPLVGRHLNVLPLLMTSLTLITSWIHHDKSLSAELHRRQQLRLYLMALGFLALFYTFPSGMVLYWTTNNLQALAVAVWTRIKEKQDRSTGES